MHKLKETQIQVWS